ncbi:cold shock and DUF1294 domain-containing protein [Flavobacterium sp. MXW15]|uniref:Cold shock and DUF1294 domain-containing protein n=1 Tax=Xanthomonas chitinilytica TaxID=2989819 RepID=A0ABT3JRF9_9XANT|nr:cold shock and DUF1294 domain-containing protein [Xanthomonas sp. H13-6]MCW4453941.1 cold shock and DUF1294 domain-containing protein [Flavobacterium sp. MXW15]MCW4471013.1 cold shock and DUF1294 domain-containing protein [Xanthomonas sp. H13-6]
MRYQGRLSDWNDEKGFGFVTPNGGGERAFVHIKAFERAPRRPRDGELISYLPQRDGRGRCNATRIRFATHPGNAPRATTRHRFPRAGLGLAALAVAAIGWRLGAWPALLPLAYAGMSVLALLLYGRDKSAARTGRWRTPESTLHLVGLLCGWPGALIAQSLFRHKSSKAGFQFVFWITVAANLAVVAWLVGSGQTAGIGRALSGA